jgi:hypothetical protein
MLRVPTIVAEVETNVGVDIRVQVQQAAALKHVGTDVGIDVSGNDRGVMSVIAAASWLAVIVIGGGRRLWVRLRVGLTIFFCPIVTAVIFAATFVAAAMVLL